MASRSSADAIRFTATEPHAYLPSKPVPSSAASTTSPDTPQRASNHTDPENAPPKFSGTRHQPQAETPKEKVARLRAARMAQRSQQLGLWERTIIRGRVWADRAHRSVVTGLALFSVIAFGATVFVFTDTLIHNRQRRAAFQKERHRIYQARLVAAIETEKAGLPLDDDQLLIMARERAKLLAEERKKEQGWWKWLGGKLDDFFIGELRITPDPIIVPTEKEMLEKMGVDSVAVLVASEGKATLNARGEVEGVEETDLVKAIRRKRVEMGLEEMGPAEITTAAKEREGGMLDRIAEKALSDASATTTKSSGWLNWGK